MANIPQIQAQKELIEKILNTDYVERAGIDDFENIRENLRNLMKYIPHGQQIYNTNFTDNILDSQWNESELENDDLANYKAKDFSVLQEPPFTDQGSVADIFTDISVWNAIRKVIDRINANAVA